LIVSQLLEQQPDVSLEKLGPAVQAAFGPDGKPTKAAEGFARGCGVDVSALERKLDGNVEKLVFRSQRKGAATATLIPDMVREALAALPIPKRMRWGSSRDEFVRPVQWCVLLFGSTVIPATILGAESGAITRGHRFMHPEPITLKTAADYEQALMQGKVIANFAQRRDTIRKLVEEEGRKLGAQAIIEDALLDEVTALVEWPVA